MKDLFLSKQQKAIVGEKNPLHLSLQQKKVVMGVMKGEDSKQSAIFLFFLSSLLASISMVHLQESINHSVSLRVIFRMKYLFFV